MGRAGRRVPHESDGFQCLHGARGCRGVRPVPAAEPGRRAAAAAPHLPGGEPPRGRRRLVRAAARAATALWRQRRASRCRHGAHRCAGVVLIYALLKRVFVRERPFITHAGIDRAAPPLDRYSFPSGHTLHAVSFTWQCAAHFPELLLVLVPLAALIAASRVVLGLHYPSDVLAGAALGAALARAGLALASVRRATIARSAPCAAEARVRVLLLSDVYFPRVNGVSTSIRTFRNDLHAQGVETLLVAPRYADAPETAAEPEAVLRIPATARAQAILRTGACAGARSRSALDALPRGGIRPGAHPYAVPGPLCGGALRAPRRRALRGDLPHLLRGVPAPLRAGAAARARAASRRALHPLAVRRGAGADRPLGADAHGAARLRGRTPIHVLPTGLAADRFRPGDGAAFRARAGSRHSGRYSRTSDGSRTRRTSAFSCRCSPGCSRGAGGAAGDRRRGAGTRVAAGAGRRPGTERAGAFCRLPRARYRAARLLRGGGRVRVRLAHRDPGPGAAGSDGAGRCPWSRPPSSARARSWCPKAARWSCPRRRGSFAGAVVRVLRDARLRAELSAHGPRLRAQPGLRRRWRGASRSSTGGCAPGTPVYA